MTEFKKLELKSFPAIENRKTAESRFWKRFKFPIVVKEYGSISAIDFTPSPANDVAITSSSKIQIFSTGSKSVKKTISRFQGQVYSASFRNDGQLLVAGTDDNLVQIFDVNSRAILRTFRGHSAPVHVTRFVDKERIFSASDDKTVRCWDVAQEEEVCRFLGHEDYIRTGAVHPNNPNLFFTGSYDNTVKLWDSRTETCVLTCDHHAPVESLVVFAGGTLAVSAGGCDIKVWDLLQGGKLLKKISNHQKTITSLCLDSNQSRLLSGSLDHHVKVYDVTDYKVVHSMKNQAPVMSLGLSADDTHLAVGMSNGVFLIRKRIVSSDTKAGALLKKSSLQAGTYKYFVRGKSHTPCGDYYQVPTDKKKKLKPYDAFLKKFQYQNALDAVLDGSQKAVIIVSLFEELIRRNGSKIALTGRDEVTLEPVLRFLTKNIDNPRYSTTLIHIANEVLDIYACVVGQSVQIDELLSKLHKKLKMEILLQKR
eukprot:Sdes_comp17629_c0_seq1m6896